MKNLVLCDYQQRAKAQIIRAPDCGIFLEMGLGKTAITLSALNDLLFDYCSIDTALIVAPGKVAQDTWQAEGRNWNEFKNIRFSSVIGTPKQRIKALKAKAECYVISRENFVWLCKIYRYVLPFDVLIVDESTSFKDSSTKRFKAMKKVRGCFKRRIILTGTPRPKTFLDLWAQIYILDGGLRLENTISMYRNKYFKIGAHNGHVVYEYLIRDQKAAATIQNRIKDICISMTASEYLKLPPVIKRDISVYMNDQEAALYKRLKKDLTISIGDHEITAAFAASLSNKLLQMANGAIYDDEHNVIGIHDRKIDALAEIVDSNETVLVFYAYKHDADRIEKRFKKQVRRLNTAKDQQDWNDGKIKILLAHPASCAYGLNLQQGGSVVVWFGLTWSLERYLQANARLYRRGQSHTVIIHHLITANTLDSKVLAVLEGEKLDQDKFIKAVKLELEA